MDKKIKVLIVDDSLVRRNVLKYIISSDFELEITSFAKGAEETFESIRRVKPDIITMDINISDKINGFELTRQIVDRYNIPIIIISGIRNESNKKKIETAMMESGALYFIDAPPGPWCDSFDEASQEIIRQIKLHSKPDKIMQNLPKMEKHIKPDSKSKDKLIVIGVSTGGPSVLKEVLSDLPDNFRTPIIIAQHISKGFDSLLVSQLNKISNIPVKIAENNEIIEQGNIYFAPAEKITKLSFNQFSISNPPKDYKGHLPSISVLMGAINTYYSSNVLGIILTGMGEDGVDELKNIRNNGNITIAQDKESSTVYGMPKKAAEKGAAKYVMTPSEINKFIIRFDAK